MDRRPDAPLTGGQAGALLWGACVSGVLRQVPGSLYGAAGGGAWLSALLCVPAAALLGLGLGRLLSARAPGEGPGELLCRAVGSLPGRALAGLYGAWFVFYAGYVLRAGADRLTAAIYPESGEWVFMAVTALLAVLAGRGRRKTLGRCAQLIVPLLLGVFALVLIFSLPMWETVNLRPGRWGAAGVARGTLPMLSILAVGAYPALLAGRTGKGGLVLPMCGLALLGTALGLAVTAVFGAPLAQRMNYPYFVMIRSVKVFDLLERMEALAAAQWAAADFLLLGTLLHLAAGSFALALRGPGQKPGAAAVWLCAAGTVLCGRLCAQDAFALRSLTRQVIDPGNAAAVYLLLPAVWAAGKLRRKL